MNGSAKKDGKSCLAASPLIPTNVLLVSLPLGARPRTGGLGVRKQRLVSWAPERSGLDAVYTGEFLGICGKLIYFKNALNQALAGN